MIRRFPLILALAVGACGAHRPATRITVVDRDVVLRTISDPHALRPFERAWLAREEIDVFDGPNWQYKVTICAGDECQFWLYDPTGYTRLLAVKNPPTYRLLDAAVFNTLLDLPSKALQPMSAGDPFEPPSGPAIIGYFPAVSEAELNNDVALASAFEHLEMALDACRVCFESKGIRVQTVRADKLTVIDGDHARTIEPSQSNVGIGALLIAPGRAGRIVDAGPGASSLVVRVPAAASEYFGLPACGSPSC